MIAMNNSALKLHFFNFHYNLKLLGLICNCQLYLPL
jgi:hypothetical protein